MSNKVFNFKTQMAVGDKGESEFCLYYPELEPLKSKEKSVDFILKDGRIVEVKTESRCMNTTPNFFMETMSHGKIGGPWRAKQDGVDDFVVYFIQNKTFFWFEPITLCDRLEFLITTKKFKLKTIWNPNWTAEGYAIPRSELEDVTLKQDVFI